MGTLFASVYNRFLGKITDDMYMEITPEQTVKDLQNLLINAIPGFEFPRKILDYEILMREIEPGDSNIYGFVIGNMQDASSFYSELTSEEINILAILMVENWLQRQITSIEITRMKYSGTDFKMTSQANHLTKLQALLKEMQRQSLHTQRLYKRRRTNKAGQIESNWSVLSENSVLNGFNNIQEEEEQDITHIIFDGGII